MSGFPLACGKLILAFVLGREGEGGRKEGGREGGREGEGGRDQGGTEGGREGPGREGGTEKTFRCVVLNQLSNNPKE